MSSETITARISKWATGVEFAQLSPEAVREAKRYLLDSLGCALGGFRQSDVGIAMSVLGEHAGSGPATVIGSGAKMDPISASLLNALMVRVMDFNDIYVNNTAGDDHSDGYAETNRGGRNGPVRTISRALRIS